MMHRPQAIGTIKVDRSTLYTPMAQITNQLCLHRRLSTVQQIHTATPCS